MGLTLDQEKWLAHLSREKKITIVPFDPTSEEKLGLSIKF